MVWQFSWVFGLTKVSCSSWIYAKDNVPQCGMADGGNTPHLCEEYYRSRPHCMWRMISPRLWHF
jgi:hypothetical protein